MGYESAPRRRGRLRSRALWPIFIFAALLSGCAGEPPEPAEPPASVAPHSTPADAHVLIDQLLPGRLTDRPGWVTDLYAGLTVQAIEPSRENICAVIAVIKQESGFHVDPVVPGLGKIAAQEIERRAQQAHVPRVLMRAALNLPSADGHSFGDRIDRARTEKDLSDVYEDFIAAVPMGRTLFAGKNPIRTRGPMQVNIAFAESYAASRPYPYPVKISIDDEVFTRRGSLYFGVGHLLAYAAAYDRMIYRFADFNAGQYASRNAAFQAAVGVASGIPLVPDGALMPHEETADAGSTESALRALGERLNLSVEEIHDDLTQGKTRAFERTAAYRRVFSLADRMEGRPLARALIPHIELHGPKLTHRLTTEWYARRVDQRFQKCLRP